MPVKITDLTASTTITSNDLIQIIDSDDITFSPTGTNKKITADNAANQLANLITSVPPIVVSALSSKANLSSPTFSGNVSLPDTTAIGPVNSAEIGRLSGVTSGIQGQLDLKAPLASPNFSGNVVLPNTTAIGSVTNAEIGRLSGVTSGIQGQLDLKAPLASPNFSGNCVISNPNNSLSTAIRTGNLHSLEIYGTRSLSLCAPDTAIRGFGIAGTITAPTALADSTGAVSLNGFAWNGSSFNGYGYGGIAAITINTKGAQTTSNGGSSITFTTTVQDTVNVPVERMRIDHNGNVGIGADSPNVRLVVASNSTLGDVAIAVVESTHATSNRAAILFGSWNVGQDLHANGDRNYYIYDNRTRMEISSSASTDLDNVRFRNVNNGAQYWYYNKQNQSGIVSDERTKNTIQKLDTAEALQYINRISPSTFISNGNTELQAGFIAQDLLENATTTDQKTTINNHKTYDKDDPYCPILGVADRPLVAYLVAAMQEQQKIIDTLQTRLDALEK